ncbi:MAG: WYL domain-containing protein [Prevotella sp.]|nr:WYL domain-containing protein [Prevotella sp.]
MANTKQYSIRERVLDDYLKKGWYSRQQLITYCNRALEKVGYLAISSRQTFFNDLAQIESQYKIVIEKLKKGRTCYYRYKDETFSIYNPKLSEEDIQCLDQALEVLNSFKGMPQFDWVAEFKARFETSIKADTNKMAVVAFQDTSHNTGMEHFTTLYDAIIGKTAIDITYKSFKVRNAKISSISPYLLKQHNNRWFLIGRTIGYNDIGVFPLDRIEEICESHKAYEESGIDFNDYFKDVIGVTIPKGQDVEKVEIWFSEEQLRYVETKPLHKSQEVIQRDKNGGIIQIDVIVNYELEQSILSFGEKAKVLSPTYLKDNIKHRIAENLKNY